jgi:ABC-type multidrug transport system fused ATPase/permease subunit
MFNNVGYRYQSGEKSETLSGVTFTIGKGQRVALVGPSGAGKSTLQYLALRFMDPNSGVICANGTDIKDLTLRSWRRAVAYIPQRSQIFDGTVRENLLYALSREERKSWGDERLQKLMSVLAIDFGRRPVGENPLDVIVGREGVQLSGGQAQRLAIGAAVIKSPRLMLIDEATSALDSTTEKAVLDGLNELVSGISTLVIAHRLSTVRSADKVVVIVDGSVEASGASFAELHETSPTFRQLAKDQNLAIV